MLELLKVAFDFIAAGVGITVILGVGGLLFVTIINLVQHVVNKITS